MHRGGEARFPLSQRVLAVNHYRSGRDVAGNPAAGAGLAAVTYLGRVPGAFGGARVGGHPTVLQHLLGVQHFSVRDATARLGIASSTRLGVAPTMGRLGGPNYPADPNDLGPLVPLPGGYAEVFEYLASVGIAG